MKNYVVSARKYRPSTFASVVGQKALTTTLKNAVATNRLAHSYLFCGSRGVGKTSCARIFAKTINCSNITPDGEACNECESCRAFNRGTSMNIIELDAASNNGVNDIRNLVEQVQVPPSLGRYRVFIVDEVHMLSSAAFNAFLKTLEEPPSYVVFILATTEKHKIIPTILSRCQIYDFHRITIRDMVDHLTYVASQEGITVEAAALNVIARNADGAMRDALSIFDQVVASSGGNVTYQATIDALNVLDSSYYNRLLDEFLAGNVLNTWLIYKEIRDNGFDSLFFINGLGAYLRDLTVARDPSTLSLLDAGDEVRKAMAEKAAKCTPEFLFRAMNLCNEADLNYRQASNKQFLIELTLAKLCQLLSPSPSKSGDGEGRLKPIAASGATAGNKPQQQPQAPRSAPASATPAVTAVPRAAAGATPAPGQPPRTAPAPRAAAPVMGGTRPQPMAVKGAMSFSIKNARSASSHPDVAAEAPAGSYGAPLRDTPVDPAELAKVWSGYARDHRSETILSQTMRMSRPQTGEKPEKFTVTVQNIKQKEILEVHRAAILDALKDALKNDSVWFDVDINEGEGPRHTLSDYDLLEELKKQNPHLVELIKTFKLRL